MFLSQQKLANACGERQTEPDAERDLPFVKATTNGNTTYTPYLQNGTGSWNTTWNGKTLDGHRLAVDVPDDQTTIDFTLKMWSYDSSGADKHTDIGLRRVHAGGECYDENEVTRTYEIGSVGGSTRYELADGGCSSIYAVSLVVVVSTVTPDRVGSRLILPLDYSGVYNVTDSTGALVSRRYVGEPRFVALVLNVTTAGDWTCVTPDGCDNATVGAHVLLVPRSVFNDTFLGKKLADGNSSEIPDNLAFYQNGTGSNNSDALQQVIAGNVTADEYFRILGWLLRNTTGNATNRVVNVTGDLFLYSLPDDAIRLVGYRPVPVAHSVSYRFCPPGGCVEPPPPPWWEQIWRGIVIVATFILSGILFVANAFVVLGEILVAVGSWIVRQIVAFIDFVAGALQAAAKVLGQFFDWILDIARQTLNALLAPILGLLESYKERIRAGTAEAFTEFEGDNPSMEEHADRAAALMLALFITGSLEIFVALFLALVAAEIILTPYTTLARALLPIITGLIIGLIVSAVGLAVLPVAGAQPGTPQQEAIPNQVVDFVPPSAWWNARAPFVIGRFLSTFVLLVIGKAGLTVRTAISVGLSIAALALFFIGPTLSGGWAIFAAVFGLGSALVSLLLAITASLKTALPVVWYFSVGLAVISIAVAGASLAAVT